VKKGGIKYLPVFAQREKEGRKQLGNSMQTTIEAVSNQHMRNIVILTQKLASHTKVASKVQHRDNRRSHHFCIAQLALSIFDVLQSFQQIVTQARYEYNLSVPAFLRFCFGLSTYTLPENVWEFYRATPR